MQVLVCAFVVYQPENRLLPLWESVIVLCFVVRYFMSILVLQSSWWGGESWLLCLICLPGVSWWLSGSSSWCHGVVCSLWLWYFLIILTYYFLHCSPYNSHHRWLIISTLCYLFLLLIRGPILPIPSTLKHSIFSMQHSQHPHSMAHNTQTKPCYFHYKIPWYILFGDLVGIITIYHSTHLGYYITIKILFSNSLLFWHLKSSPHVP